MNIPKHILCSMHGVTVAAVYVCQLVAFMIFIKLNWNKWHCGWAHTYTKQNQKNIIMHHKNLMDLLEIIRRLSTCRVHRHRSCHHCASVTHPPPPTALLWYILFFIFRTSCNYSLNSKSSKISFSRCMCETERPRMPQHKIWFGEVKCWWHYM